MYSTIHLKMIGYCGTTFVREIDVVPRSNRTRVSANEFEALKIKDIRLCSANKVGYGSQVCKLSAVSKQRKGKSYFSVKCKLNMKIKKRISVLVTSLIFYVLYKKDIYILCAYRKFLVFTFSQYYVEFKKRKEILYKKKEMKIKFFLYLSYVDFFSSVHFLLLY